MTLPAHDAFASVTESAPLVESLRERISRDGPITFRDYMDVVLYDPQHGYYSTHAAAMTRPAFADQRLRPLQRILRRTARPQNQTRRRTPPRGVRHVRRRTLPRDARRAFYARGIPLLRTARHPPRRRLLCGGQPRCDKRDE